MSDRSQVAFSHGTAGAIRHAPLATGRKVRDRESHPVETPIKHDGCGVTTSGVVSGFTSRPGDPGGRHRQHRTYDRIESGLMVPPKSAALAVERTVNVRLSSESARRLRVVAAKQGISMGAYLARLREDSPAATGSPGTKGDPN
jgi:predicted DNA binding CopG/RHH family protein